MAARLKLDTGPDVGPGTGRLAEVRACSVLERMPKWLICVPLVVQWLWLSARYGGPTVPAAANPHLTAGGLVGEGKLEYFRGMGPLARSLTAAHCAVFNEGTADASALQHATQAMAQAGLAFPVVAKPDLGLCGYGVRLLHDEAALQAYLAAFPRGETVVLQRYLPQEGEAGIFYARDPVTGKGRVIGLALRYFPRVTGDGRSTVAQLVAADVRARRIARSPRHQCSVPPDSVPAAGQQVRLATIGSTRVGGLYRDGAALITPELVRAIDAVARDMPDFQVRPLRRALRQPARTGRGARLHHHGSQRCGLRSHRGVGPRHGRAAGLSDGVRQAAAAVPDRRGAAQGRRAAHRPARTRAPQPPAEPPGRALPALQLSRTACTRTRPPRSPYLP
jgi:hypothetical protein